MAEYLIRGCGHKHQIYVGTSTGALLVPMIAADKLEEIKTTYENVRSRDVFNINPFTVQKKGKIFHTKINHLNTIRMFLKKKKTFGETKNLRKLI